MRGTQSQNSNRGPDCVPSLCHVISQFPSSPSAALQPQKGVASVFSSHLLAPRGAQGCSALTFLGYASRGQDVEGDRYRIAAGWRQAGVRELGANSPQLKRLPGVGLVCLTCPWAQHLGNLAYSTDDPMGNIQAPMEVLGEERIWG